MNAIIYFLLISIVISVPGYTQQLDDGSNLKKADSGRQNENNKKDLEKLKKDFESHKVDNDNQNQKVAKDINELKKENEIQKIRLENAYKLVESADKFISFGEYIGIGVTALLVGVGAFNYFSFKNSKRKLKKFLNKSNEELDATRKEFKEFINSPSQIREVLEKMNYEEITKGLNGFDENLFSVSIGRAQSLSDKMRKEVAELIKSKIYDPEYSHLVFQIYNYLKLNLDIENNKFALSLWNHFNGVIPNNMQYYFINEIFNRSPYPIEPYEFIEKLLDQKLENAILNLFHLLGDEESWILLQKCLLNNLALNYNSVIPSGIKNSTNLTEFIAKNEEQIGDKIFIQIGYKLVFNKELVQKRLRKNNNLREQIDPYITATVKNPEEFSFLVGLIDLKIEDNWKSLFNYHATEVNEQVKSNILRSNYEKVRAELPKGDFLNDVLPLLFNKDFGVLKENDKYYFRDKELPVEMRSDFFGGKLQSYVQHPEIGVYINIDNINEQE